MSVRSRPAKKRRKKTRSDGGKLFNENLMRRKDGPQQQESPISKRKFFNPIKLKPHQKIECL